MTYLISERIILNNINIYNHDTDFVIIIINSYLTTTMRNFYFKSLIKFLSFLCTVGASKDGEYTIVDTQMPLIETNKVSSDIPLEFKKR